MKVYEVANIEEAVDLAYELKNNGSYNWFRGQVQDWPPYSSHNRLLASRDSEKIKKSERRFELFFDWVGKIPELRYLQNPEHVHDFFAIMQHYGIPTNYIDFTTNPGVAGFFTADTANPPTEGKSCIYCLNTDELMSVWDDLKNLDDRKGASIELVKIDVRNLWRLQAQEGVFLFANYNWDIDYPMDRVLFPYSGYPSYPTRERIYPEDKSSLEQLLDQYFSLEKATFFQQWLHESHVVRVFEAPSSYFDATAFIDNSHLVPLQSWSSEALQLWECAPEEGYSQTIGSTLKLRLKPNASAEEIRKLVSFGVKQSIRSDPGIRLKTVNWEGTELPESLSKEELSDCSGQFGMGCGDCRTRTMRLVMHLDPSRLC
jgi:FRG domain